MRNIIVGGESFSGTSCVAEDLANGFTAVYHRDSGYLYGRVPTAALAGTLENDYIPLAKFRAIEVTRKKYFGGARPTM